MHLCCNRVFGKTNPIFFNYFRDHLQGRVVRLREQPFWRNEPNLERDPAKGISKLGWSSSPRRLSLRNGRTAEPCGLGAAHDARAARRIKSAISCGCEIRDKWLACTSIVVAPIRLAMNR